MRYSATIPSNVMPGTGSHPGVANSTATANTQIIGYLGRALSLEFSAGQHYLAQASLSKFRQEMDFAQGFITLANEEFQHANLITDRMVAHGVLPAGSILQPAGASQNIVDALKSCEAKEIALIQLYAEAENYSSNTGSSADAELFHRLLEEEKAQLSRVQTWINDYLQALQTAPQPVRSFV